MFRADLSLSRKRQFGDNDPPAEPDRARPRPRPRGYGGGMSDERIESQWWFNDKTKTVEQGPQSPQRDRIGPFETREEAQHALDRIKANNERWDDEDQ